MDLEGVRTFVAVAEAGQFQEAAIDLHVTQQAVSKRIAALERSLGTALFARTARGASLTLDGQAFLPHARSVLRAADRAAASVRPGERALRVDVVHPRIAPAQLLRRFHQAHPEVELDVITLPGADIGAAVAALRRGEIDVSFRAVLGSRSDGLTAARRSDGMAAASRSEGITAVPLLEDPLQLLVGPSHPLAGSASVRTSELAGHRIWIPGIRPGTEWAAFYEDLSARFGLRIDALGPHFGTEALMEEIAGSPALATLVGSGDRYVWPAAYDLRRIPLTDPAPAYPHSLLHRTGNPHPSLPALLSYLS
jgi:DNA-binding transcriptional LysR family regulator